MLHCLPTVLLNPQPYSWEEAALERAKQVFATGYRTTAKSLERATADRIMSAMLGNDRRFRCATLCVLCGLCVGGCYGGPHHERYARQLSLCTTVEANAHRMHNTVSQGPAP